MTLRLYVDFKFGLKFTPYSNPSPYVTILGPSGKSLITWQKFNTLFNEQSVTFSPFFLLNTILLQDHAFLPFFTINAIIVTQTYDQLGTLTHRGFIWITQNYKSVARLAIEVRCSSAGSECPGSVRTFDVRSPAVTATDPATYVRLLPRLAGGGGAVSGKFLPQAPMRGTLGIHGYKIEWDQGVQGRTWLSRP